MDRVIRSSFKHRDSLRAISREDLLKQSCVGVGTALASAARRRFRNAYNLTAMSIAPAEIAVEIREHVREVSIDYHVDPVRQSKTQIVGWKVPWYTKCEFACPLTEDRASHSRGASTPLDPAHGAEQQHADDTTQPIAPLVPILAGQCSSSIICFDEPHRPA